MPGLGQPLMLWSLLGLLVPVLIHLWNRKKKKPLPIGSTQFLGHRESSKFKNIQLKDKSLLLLRMLCLVLLAFLLSDPFYLKNTVEEPREIVFVDPSLPINLIADLLPIYREQGYEEIRYLSPGLPMAAELPDNRTLYPLADLLRDPLLEGKPFKLKIIHSGYFEAFSDMNWPENLYPEWVFPLDRDEHSLTWTKTGQNTTESKRTGNILRHVPTSLAADTLLSEHWVLYFHDDEKDLYKIFALALESIAEAEGIKIEIKPIDTLSVNFLLERQPHLPVYIDIDPDGEEEHWDVEIQNNRIEVRVAINAADAFLSALRHGSVVEHFGRILSKERELDLQYALPAKMDLPQPSSEELILKQSLNKASLFFEFLALLVVMLILERYLAYKKFAQR